jgi:hypothetical protein
MPYDPRQAKAIFLSIKRKKGERAARAFGKKHREDFKAPARAYKPRRRG